MSAQCQLSEMAVYGERHLLQKKFEMPVHGFMLEIRYTPRLEP